jgi:hypothetical protein
LGGALSHFQSKVQREVKERKKKHPLAAEAAASTNGDDEASPAKAAKPFVPLRSRKTGGQLNKEWRNKKAIKEDIGAKYNAALAEATKLIAGMQDGSINNGMTMQAAIDSINTKYGLSAADKENKSERQALVLKTVRRNIAKGNVGTDALSKGKTPQISRDWLKLIAVHANMCQVGATGELNVAQSLES